MNKCYNFATATATPAAGCVYKGVRRKSARQNSLHYSILKTLTISVFVILCWRVAWNLTKCIKERMAHLSTFRIPCRFLGSCMPSGRAKSCVRFCVTTTCCPINLCFPLFIGNCGGLDLSSVGILIYFYAWIQKNRLRKNSRSGISLSFAVISMRL